MRDEVVEMNGIVNVNGIININKEKGYTSHDVVAIVRKKFGKVKTGHAGTLDPQAEGVLPVCIGRSTKLVDYLASDKAYRAELILGKTTDTDDHTGVVLSACDTPKACEMIEEVKEAAKFFIGGYEQVPPMYSAIKTNGKKLYELARSGQVIERKPRKVEIYNIEVSLEVTDEDNGRMWLDVDCGKGTYIRSLCRDIGQKLGYGGCMGDLIRTKSGPFTIDTAIKLSELEKVELEQIGLGQVELEKVELEQIGLGQMANQALEQEERRFLVPLSVPLLVPPHIAVPAPHGVIKNEKAIKPALNGNPIALENVKLDKPLNENEYCWIHHETKTAKNIIGLYTLNSRKLKPEVLML